MKKIKHFIINGDNVVIMHQLLVPYVIVSVLEFKLIYVFGVIELNMVLVMELKLHVISAIFANLFYNQLKFIVLTILILQQQHSHPYVGDVNL